MKSFSDCMEVYKKELNKGDIKRAYKGLMYFFKALKSHFQYACLDFSVTSNLYFGCMDLTFISFSTELLKQKKLKIVIAFNHDKFRFEVWLAAGNKNIQEKYLKLLKANNWNKYHLASTTKNTVYISDFILIEEPDFSDLDRLTRIIEQGAVEFINTIEEFLSEH